MGLLRSRRLGPVIAAVFGVLISFLLMEGFARALKLHPFTDLYLPDAKLGWVLRPGVSGVLADERTVPVRINQAGFRDRDHAAQKPPGVYRIVVLGDSYVFGVGVGAEERFTTVLEQRLAGNPVVSGKRVEMINLGVAGYGPPQELILERSRAFAYEPDLVLQAFFSGNDVGDSSRALNEGHTERPYFVYRDGKLEEEDSFRAAMPAKPEGVSATRWLRTHSALVQTLTVRLVQPLRSHQEIASLRNIENDRRAGVPSNANRVMLPPASNEMRDAWRVVDAVLTLTAKEAREHGARYLLVEIPPEIAAHPDGALRAKFAARMQSSSVDYPTRHLQELSANQRFEFLPLGSALRKAAEERHAPVYGFDGSGFGHWNREGHRAAADAITAYLGRSVGFVSGHGFSRAETRQHPRL